MAYTNVWTTQAPLDTQAANQGAVDFRATKLDVMQRIASFGAGLFANRPTPEATSVSADWTGVMYWATDTRQTFRWNGSAWVDISISIPPPTTSFIFSAGNMVTGPADTTEDTVYTGTLVANSLGSTGGLVINFSFNLVVTGTITIRVYVGTQIFSTAFVANVVGVSNTIFLNFTSGNQGTDTTIIQSGTDPIVTEATTTIDTTVNQTVKVTVQKTVALDTAQFTAGYCKML